MNRRQAFAWSGILLALVVALAVAACAPAPEPTAAPPEPTIAPPATTTAPVEPVATTAVAAPIVAMVEEIKIRPLPVLHMPAPNPKAKHGGIYRKMVTREPEDYAAWESASGTVLEGGIIGHDSLLDRNEFEPDKNHQILANVTYDWWTDQSGEKWTFKLREGIKFHDGVPFTCADAKFSLDTLRLGRDATGDELRRSPRGAFLTRVTETRCPDDHTLDILTDGPLASLPATLAVSSFAILPRHVFEGHLELIQTQPGPGMGPWILAERVPTEYIRYKRNPNYWNQPYPYIDERYTLIMASSAAASAAMRVGRGEGGYFNFPPAVQAELIAQGRLWQPVTGVADGFLGYHTNWRRQPWGDKRFALAMRCAIDSRKAIDTAGNERGFEGPVFPLAKDTGGSEWALTEEEWKAVHPCHGPSGSKENMEKRREIARGLLKDMGFGPTNPARPSSYREGDDPFWVSILDDLALVGVYPQLQSVTNARRYEIQTAGDADILQQGFVTSRRDPDHWLYEHYYSTSNRNYGGYVNAEVDALINLQSRTLDKVERYKILKQIEKILLQDNAKLVINHSQNSTVFAPWVKDIYWGEPGNDQNTSVKLVRVWIDPEAKKALGY